MKRLAFGLICLASLFALGADRGIPTAVAPRFPSDLDPAFGSLPLTFIPNRGQVDGPAEFYARTAAYTLWLTKGSLVFDSRSPLPTVLSPVIARETTRLTFLDADPNPEIVAQDPAAGIVSYILGGDPDAWTTGLPTSRAVLYRGLYKNIDLKLYGREQTVEYDWVVAPGGRVADIRFRIDGASGAAIDADGNLVVRAWHGVWTQRRPVAYQKIDGRRTEVRVDFRRAGDGAFGFEAAPYNASLPLLIDPVISLKFSTLLGGGKDETGRDVAVASTGNVFVVGETNSLDFPVKFGYSRALAGSQDIFVTKFTVTGKDLVYSTYIGGKGADRANGIALKGMNAFVTGSTTSSDFPVKNGFNETYKGSGDAFVLKLHAAGDELMYSTFLGGGSADVGRDIAVDDQGAAYVTGVTDSSDFPLMGEVDAKRAGHEAFVAKLTPAGRDLVYSTFLGGAGSDEGNGIALNRLGSAYVVGTTSSRDFPVFKAFDSSYNANGDVFVAGLAASGRSLLFATYLGGSKRELGNGIAVDGAGALYLTGQTESSNFPLKNPYDNAVAGKDAFVAKLAANGQKLIYSTFLGGGRTDAGQAIAVQTDGTAQVAGSTLSNDFPSYGGLGNAYGGEQDAFLTKLTARGDAVLYSAFLGGKNQDAAFGVAAAAGKTTYVTGVTSSADFPLKLAYDADLNGGSDAFVVKFADTDMKISYVRLYYGGLPAPSEVDVVGEGFGDRQGNRLLTCDGVIVPVGKTLVWSSNIVTLAASGWIDNPIYWDHTYRFAIVEEGTQLSNTRYEKYPIHIDIANPPSGNTTALISIYGYGFGATQGTKVLKLGSYTWSIVSWSNAHIQARVPAAPAGTYNIYVQRGSEVISETEPFTHL